MSNHPFMQLYVGDYLADTTALTTEQHGAYLLLLMAMWTHGGKLPNDPKKLARIARTTPRKWAAIWDGLEQFFEVADGVILNKRLTEEYQKASRKSEIRANAGSRGGRAKALKTKEAALAKATDLLQHSPEPEPYREKEEPNGSSKKKRGTRLPDDWVLPRAWGEWALSQGYPEGGIRDQADRFRDYWIAATGRNATKRDWLATWRNWCRNNLSKSSTGERHERPRTAQERAAADHSHVASAWIAEGRRRDQERGLDGGEAGTGDPGDFGMDRREATDAVVSLFPTGTGHDGFGGGGFGLADHSQPIPASGHRGGLR